MKKGRRPSPNTVTLRRRAGAQMRKKPLTADQPKTMTEALRLIHELQGRQIELELQNRELRETCARLECGLRHDADSGITAREQATESLHESEARLRSVLRAAPLGIGLVVNRVIQEVNPAMCQMLGYTREELINKSARVLYPSQEDFDFVGAEKYRQILAQGLGMVETRWRRKDSDVLSVLLSSVPLDVTDLSKGVAFSALDITERKRSEEALQESERRFRTLVELLPYGVQENDCEGRITFANPVLERLHGQWEGGVVGRFIWDFLVDAADRERLRDYLQFLVREQPPPETYFSKDRRADGALIDVQVDWAYNRDQYGQVQGFIAVITDITGRRKAELRLAEYTERLQHLSRRLLSIQEEERRTLARELHDDFGQQLTVLKFNLAKLKRNLTDMASQSYIADSFDIVDRTLAQLRNTAINLRPSVLDDLGLASVLHWYARRQMEHADCEIVVRDDLPPLPTEIETTVFRIVQEAVNNAIRHGRARHIDITIEVTGQRLTLVIQDDGSGFETEVVSAKPGADMGLMGMRERAEGLGGDFTLESQPTLGTVINVVIPVSGVKT